MNLLQEMKVSKNCSGDACAAKGTAWIELYLKNIFLAKYLERIKVRIVVMSEMGESPPLYVWDVRTLHSWYNEVGKVLLSAFALITPQLQCFVRAAELVFCI